MNTVFLDTNIILDFFMKRKGFEEDADYIITRNTKDFLFSDISILTPKEFLSL